MPTILVDEEIGASLTASVKARLAPYLAITEPERAPVGSKMAQLVAAEAQALARQETATADADAARAARLDARVRELQRQNAARSFAAAASDVVGAHPELYDAYRRDALARLR
jgi:hypothetical protein